MALRYTVAECEAQIEAIRAKLAEIRGLPTSGTVGRTTIDQGATFANLEREELKWLGRLEAAHRANGTIVGHARREV